MAASTSMRLVPDRSGAAVARTALGVPDLAMGHLVSGVN